VTAPALAQHAAGSGRAVVRLAARPGQKVAVRAAGLNYFRAERRHTVKKAARK